MYPDPERTRVGTAFSLTPPSVFPDLGPSLASGSELFRLPLDPPLPLPLIIPSIGLVPSLRGSEA